MLIEWNTKAIQKDQAHYCPVYFDNTIYIFADLVFIHLAAPHFA